MGALLRELVACVTLAELRRRPRCATRRDPRWIADDPDPATRDELTRVLAGAMAGTPGAADDLADRMAGPLRFGTAGLRGPVRAGPSGMNVAVVRRATAGLAAWLARDGQRRRRSSSAATPGTAPTAFAAAAAEVFAGAGFTVHVLPAPLPTPVLAFAVRHLGAVAGVQITASHNPPADNGYKVYLADGAQLAPPSDARDRGGDHGGAARAARCRPRRRAIDVGRRPRPTWTGSGGSPAAPPATCGSRSPRCTASAARPPCTRCARPGSPTSTSCRRRPRRTRRSRRSRSPTPRSPAPPTCCSRWPPRSAPTSRSRSTRTPTAARWPSRPPWRQLTGDETGVLLGDHLLRSGGYTDPLVATTVVSSSMLRAVAAAHGARYAETLTGFKWIVRGGPGLVYGYEEALGYCVDPDAVRDKDGIAAAVLACDLAATLKAAGAGLPDRLDALAREHGVHATAGVSVRMEPAARDAAVERLRAAPPAGLDDRAPGPGRAGAAPRRRTPGGPPVGHRAEAEGVPGGRRAARRRRPAARARAAAAWRPREARRSGRR